ncbi:MAG: ABC transporter substrate-binding protein [Spirochaetia bacterium]|jgi:glucose/mannose transport system substrate-binding protein
MNRFRALCAAFFFAAGAVTLFAAGSPESSQGHSLEIFSWWTAGGEAEGLAAMFDIYHAKYPGIGIFNATVAGGAGSNAKSVLVTRMRGGNPPDSFQVHAGHELIDSWVVAGKMEPITFLFRDNGWLDSFPAGLVKIISYKGEIYSVPVNIHRSNILWYNKKIFAENRLTPPESLDGLLSVADELARAGVTPLALGDNGVWAAVHLLESVLLGTMGPTKYQGLWSGATDWDGPEVRASLTRFASLQRYVNTDHAALSWDAAVQYVIDGKCAMTIMGDWAEGYFKAKGCTPGREFGWVPSPGTRGSFLMLSDSFGLPKGAPDRDAAVKWLTVAASREGQDAFNPKKGSIPSRTDGDRALYDLYQKSAMDSFRSDTIVPSVTHGAAAAESWVNDIQDTIALFICDLNVDKAAAGLQRAARKYVK